MKKAEMEILYLKDDIITASSAFLGQEEGDEFNCKPNDLGMLY